VRGFCIASGQSPAAPPRKPPKIDMLMPFPDGTDSGSGSREKEQIGAAIQTKVSIMRSIFVLAFLVGLLPTAAYAANPRGVWSAGEGRIHVKIDRCGDVLCGKIIWVSQEEAEEASRKGQPPIIGVKLLSDLKPSSDRSDQWEGNVYNLQDGRTYSVYLRPDNEAMEVEGCLLMFCRTQLWPRVTKAGEDGSATQ
jgi:uncharacterized protein (DUF2147 family)